MLCAVCRSIRKQAAGTSQFNGNLLLLLNGLQNRSSTRTRNDARNSRWPMTITVQKGLRCSRSHAILVNSPDRLCLLGSDDCAQLFSRLRARHAHASEWKSTECEPVPSGTTSRSHHEDVHAGRGASIVTRHVSDQSIHGVFEYLRAPRTITRDRPRTLDIDVG